MPRGRDERGELVDRLVDDTPSHHFVDTDPDTVALAVRQPDRRREESRLRQPLSGRVAAAAVTAPRVTRIVRAGAARGATATKVTRTGRAGVARGATAMRATIGFLPFLMRR